MALPQVATVVLGTTWKLIAAASLATAVGWWPFETTYVWTRHDGDAFRVRFEIGAGNRITWVEQFAPSPRSTAAAPRPAVSQRDYYLPCAVFDRQNFECRSRADQDWIEMRGGALTRRHWGEERAYRAETRLAW